jgi:hypothetical protein
VLHVVRTGRRRAFIRRHWRRRGGRRGGGVAERLGRLGRGALGSGDGRWGKHDLRAMRTTDLPPKHLGSDTHPSAAERARKCMGWRYHRARRWWRAVPGAAWAYVRREYSTDAARETRWPDRTKAIRPR